MIIRRAATLLATLTLAVGIGTASPGTASADVGTMAGCLDYEQIDWQYNSVGNNRAMSSCLESIDYMTGYFVAYTQVISTSYWTGFHGCVKLQLIDSYTGTVVYTSPQQRWGVSAGHRRVIQWTGTAPTYGWNSRSFLHWRC